MAGDEDCEGGDHADDGDGDAVEGVGEGAGVADPVDDRSAADDEHERGDEGAEGGDCGAGKPPAESALDVVAGDETDERVDHDQGARGGFTQREPGDHVLGCQPAVVVDGRAGHEREHRVGAAERDQGGDGEEAGELGDEAARQQQEGDGDEPDRERLYEAAAQAGVERCRLGGFLVGSVPTGFAEQARVALAGQVSGQRGDGDDDRERHAGDDQAERDRGHRDRSRCVDDAAADADHRRRDQRDHRCAEATDDAGDGGHLAVLDVDGTHRTQQHEGGQHEEAAAGDRAADAVHRVADVGRELLCLGAGQGHAEVEGVQEAALADPPSPLDQLVVHDRDLPGGAAEADAAQLQPKPERLSLGRPGRLELRLARALPSADGLGVRASCVWTLVEVRSPEQLVEAVVERLGDGQQLVVVECGQRDAADQAVEPGASGAS